MNKLVKQLYFLIKDDTVICVDSNLKNFVEALPAELAGIRTYTYYVRCFSKESRFCFEFNKTYVFQRIELNRKDGETDISHSLK